VIRTFADKDTEAIFRRERVRRFQSIEIVALRALARLHAAESMNDLRAVPGNRVEKVPEFGSDSYSIRVNDKYRVIFRWDGGYADDVRITDHYTP
jgi:proteic killer suppression protein